LELLSELLAHFLSKSPGEASFKLKGLSSSQMLNRSGQKEKCSKGLYSTFGQDLLVGMQPLQQLFDPLQLLLSLFMSLFFSRKFIPFTEVSMLLPMH